jgi:hypothetical protein
MFDKKQHTNQTVRARPDSKSDGSDKPLNPEDEQMREWLRTVKFRKCLFGGVSEADVWKKLAELNNLYEAALRTERARYDARLEDLSNGPDQRLEELKQELTKKDQECSMLRERLEELEKKQDSGK